MASTSEPPQNSLGLDFNQLSIQDPPAEAKAEGTPQSPTQDAEEKKKPYINPERVKTGGNQRDKLSEEALSERMARMREQNEKIKQRRLDVQADEEAFKQTQESERAKLAQIRKVQEGVDRTREQNAKRKLDKMQNREWDSGKPVAGGDWKRQPQNNQSPKPDTPADAEKVTRSEEATATTNSPPPAAARDNGGWSRGASPRGSSPRGRSGGRGRGRGRAGSFNAGSEATPSETEAKATVTTAPTVADAPKS